MSKFLLPLLSIILAISPHPFFKLKKLSPSFRLIITRTFDSSKVYIPLGRSSRHFDNFRRQLANIGKLPFVNTRDADLPIFMLQLDTTTLFPSSRVRDLGHASRASSLSLPWKHTLPGPREIVRPVRSHPRGKSNQLSLPLRTLPSTSLPRLQEAYPGWSLRSSSRYPRGHLDCRDNRALGSLEWTFSLFSFFFLFLLFVFFFFFSFSLIIRCWSKHQLATTRNYRRFIET